MTVIGTGGLATPFFRQTNVIDHLDPISPSGASS